MKFLFILLMIPAVSIGQTVHIKDKKIVYEGEEKIAGLSADEIFFRIQRMLPVLVKDFTSTSQSAHSITADGKLKLKTPYHLVRTVAYSITVNAKNGGYKYRIDNVFFAERERGEKEVIRSSEEVLDLLGETGGIVAETEKILNETDMRFQKLLALLRSALTGPL